MTTQNLLCLCPPGFSPSFAFCLPSFLPLIYISLCTSISLSLSLIPSLAATKRLKRDYFWHVNVMRLLGIVLFFLSFSCSPKSIWCAHTHTKKLKVFWDINYLRLQNAKFWHAEATEFFVWLLLPWNNNTFCEKTMIENHNTVPCTCFHCIHTLVYLLFPRSAEEGRIRRDEWGMECERMRKEKYCFWGDNLLLWFKVLVASREMNYWL